MTTKSSMKFECGINKLWVGEKLPHGDSRWSQHTASFHREQHTLDSFIRRVTGDGYSFCPVMSKGYRTKDNFISAQHIALDDDRGTQESSLVALAEDPFIADHAAFLYGTLSSTTTSPKSRVVFILDQPFTDADSYRTAQEAMLWKFGSTDPQVKDPARFFYGRPNAEHLDLGGVLYRDILQEQVIEPYLLGSTISGANRLAEPVAGTIPEHERNNTLASMAGTMRRRGFGQAAIDSALLIENQEKCRPPLPQAEVLDIARSISRYAPAHPSLPTTNSTGKRYIPSMVIGL